MDESNEKPQQQVKSQQQTPVEFFRQISDPQKIDIIRQIAESMAPASLQEVINIIGRQQANAGGEVTLNVSAVPPAGVRLDFGKALAWFIMPKDHAVQLALMLLQASGAAVQKAAGASGDGTAPIDIEPTKPS